MPIIHWQFLGPLTLHTVQPFLQSIHNCLVNGFSLSIALRIRWGRVSVLDAKITAKLAEGLAVKLQPIVGYKRVRHPKSSDYIISHELLNIHVPNVG